MHQVCINTVYMSLLLFSYGCFRDKTFSLILPPLNAAPFRWAIKRMNWGSPPATKSLMLEFVSTTQAAPGCCCRR